MATDKSTNITVTERTPAQLLQKMSLALFQQKLSPTELTTETFTFRNDASQKSFSYNKEIERKSKH